MTSRNLWTWVTLLRALWDDDEALPGSDVSEWLYYVQSDYDEVDRLYIDHESIGG